MSATDTEQIALEYNITGPLSIIPIKGVHSSRVYCIYQETSNKKYCLRLPTNFSRSAVVNEIHILQQLKNTPLATTSILLDTEGRPYFENDSGWSGTVSTWLNGTHPLSDSSSLELCEVLGKSLALFHTNVSQLPYKNRPGLISDNVEHWLSQNLPKHSTYVDSGQLLEHLRPLRSARLPKGIVHGDFHANNILINGNEVGLLDMEYVGPGVLLFDIARAAADLCTTKHALDAQKVQAFIQGYDSLRNISTAEREHFHAAVLYTSLIVAIWFYDAGFPAMGEHFIKISKSAVE